MDYARAMEQARQGKRVTRKAWNNQDRYVTYGLVLSDGDEISVVKDFEKGADREADDWEIVGTRSHRKEPEPPTEGPENRLASRPDTRNKPNQG